MRAFRGLLAILAGASLAALAFGVAAYGPARAEDGVVPAPKIVVYPGDVIQDNMLEDIPLTAAGYGGPFAFSREEVIGKISHRTLLPGRAIPVQGLDSPRLIRNGATVEMLYIDGGLTINTTGAAMQDGGVGDFIKIRNLDSGVVVQGKVQADGTVLVSGG